MPDRSLDSPPYIIKVQHISAIVNNAEPHLVLDVTSDHVIILGSRVHALHASLEHSVKSYITNHVQHIKWKVILRARTIRESHKFSIYIQLHPISGQSFTYTHEEICVSESSTLWWPPLDIAIRMNSHWCIDPGFYPRAIVQTLFHVFQHLSV